jgi:hypothetical protein
MWESPIYKFKTELANKETVIYVDVTGSAPNFKEPGKQLEATFEVLLRDLDPKRTKILDFGGAKLRNTLHLLKKGFIVYACEFEDLFSRSKQASDFLNECKKFPNFHRLVFPKEFIELREEFDVVLLINVVNIMPVPIERYYVLTLCRQKMKENGRLLWYTQHGVYSEENAVTKLFDGLVTGKGRKYNMFYRDFSRKEIHDMLSASGFSFDKDFKFPMAGTNQAYVFLANGDILVDKSLGLTEQLESEITKETKIVKRKTWKTKEEESDPTKRIYETAVPKQVTKLEGINVLESYTAELDTIPSGRADASKYHRLIFNVLKSVLENRLKRAEIEEKLADDTQRADITFQNQRENGFFKQLDEGYHITCPNIFIECKNYNGDIGNPEFAQIQNRLNKIRGQFGIIVCRKIIDLKKAKDRQKNLKNDEKFVIVLTDQDIKKLANFKVKGKEREIDDFIEGKFKQLI